MVVEADAFTRVLQLQSAGDWHRVSLEGQQGWLLRPPGPPGAPPLPATVVPPRPLPGRPPDPERLAAVEKLLGVSAPTGSLGPYPLYSDDADSELIWFLDRVAAGVEPAFRKRYGCPPLGAAAEAVVLFGSEQRYRALQALDGQLHDLPAAGHAGYGLVALYAGTRRRDEVAATLVHEITHLLTRRSLGPALPPWIDEGIAVDLAASAIGPAGEIDPGHLGGAVEQGESRIDYFGAQASVRRLAGALAEQALLPLPKLFALDWEGFVRNDRLELNYTAAGMFWRYLLEGDNGALAPRARAFLAGIAQGGPVDAYSLQGRLGTTWADLEDGFAAWVAAHAEGVDDPRAWLHK